MKPYLFFPNMRKYVVLIVSTIMACRNYSIYYEPRGCEKNAGRKNIARTHMKQQMKKVMRRHSSCSFIFIFYLNARRMWERREKILNVLYANEKWMWSRGTHYTHRIPACFEKTNTSTKSSFSRRMIGKWKSRPILSIFALNFHRFRSNAHPNCVCIGTIPKQCLHFVFFFLTIAAANLQLIGRKIAYEDSNNLYLRSNFDK